MVPSYTQQAHLHGNTGHGTILYTTADLHTNTWHGTILYTLVSLVFCMITMVAVLPSQR